MITPSAALRPPWHTLLAWWKAGLKIGFQNTAPGLLRGRVMLLNGLVIVASVSVTVFAIVYWSIGYQYFYGPLYLLPVSALVLWNNHRGRFAIAQTIYLTGSLLVIAYWSYEGRGNGNEYTLIALATTATLIVEKKWIVFLTNLACAIVFVGVKIYDAAVPFTPDPVIDYQIVPTIILLNTVGVISFQIAFFRDLARHYDEKLTSKYQELQAVEEELKMNNDQLHAVNEKLHHMTAHLENLVKQKTKELQTYIQAIDVNLYSSINDADGYFLEVNDQLVLASGYTREELLGKHYSLLATPAHQQEHATPRRRQLETGRVWRGEVEHCNKAGEYYWFDCVVIPIQYGDQNKPCFLSIGLPITERKLHEKLREKTHHILESIAFRASHNIRGPMARIKGLANLVEIDTFDPEEFKMIASKFSQCSDELSIAVRELVTFVHDHQETLQGAASPPPDRT